MPIMQSSLKMMDKLAQKIPQTWWQLPQTEDGIPLSPGLYMMTKLRKLSGAPQLDKMTPEKARKRIQFDLTSVQRGFAVGESRRISMRLQGRTLNAQHYTPASANALPVLMVFFHGGGWVTGNLKTHDDVCRLICESAGIQILSVDYRQPPEYVFPEPLNDAIDAVKWAQENAHIFSVSPHAIAVGGDSAGGNFAAVIAQDTSLPTPLLGQLLLYPCINREVDWPSRERYSKGLFLSAEESQWFYHHYLGGPDKEIGNPRVSPILGQVSAATAPALVVTAGFDILRDEGHAYAEWLAEHQVETRNLCFSSLVHAFANLAAINQDCHDAVIEFSQSFRLLLAENLAAHQQANQYNNAPANSGAVV